jgi:uncharacterized 2Fe-2S/4Fe-4S cluster protein (DUF4445 family)
MKNRALWILLVIFFFVAGAAGSYFLMKYVMPAANQPAIVAPEQQAAEAHDLIAVRILLPRDKKLEMQERKLKRRIKSIAFAEAVIEQFFKEAANEYAIPQNVKVLGIYRDPNQVLYIDLSDELRSNFQGDALDEYLLLKGMYETLVSNMQDFQDLKVLVEGKEIETLGGHFFLKYPLKNIVLPELKNESASAHE